MRAENIVDLLTLDLVDLHTMSLLNRPAVDIPNMSLLFVDLPPIGRTCTE